MNQDTALTLYSYWRSSSSWRVRLQLEAKGLDYTYVPVHLVRDGGQQHEADFMALNPMRQIPYLHVAREGATPYGVAQSMAIMELVEELFPETPTLPVDVAARAHARQLAELVNSGIQPLQNLAVIQHLRDELEQDAPAFCRHWITKGLAAYEASLASDPARFSVGDTPSIADFCLVPQLYNARRFKIDLGAFPRLLAIEEQMKALPFFDAAHPDNQPDADPNA